MSGQGKKFNRELLGNEGREIVSRAAKDTEFFFGFVFPNLVEKFQN